MYTAPLMEKPTNHSYSHFEFIRPLQCTVHARQPSYRSIVDQPAHGSQDALVSNMSQRSIFGDSVGLTMVNRKWAGAKDRPGFAEQTWPYPHPHDD